MNCATASRCAALVEAMAVAAGHLSPGGEGVCLLASAALAYHLMQGLGVTGVEAVRGEYLGEAHWWLEVDGQRLDPTRRQFDDRPVISPTSEVGFYVAQNRWPAAWTWDHVIAEADRCFGDPADADDAVAVMFLAARRF